MTQYKFLIGGALVEGDSEMDVVNPATEEILATCPRASRAQLEQAIAAAKEASTLWGETALEARQRALIRMAEVIEQNDKELIRLLSSEQGKPIAESTIEVLGAAAFTRYFATLDLPVTILEDSKDRLIEAHRKPLGVVGAIIPWNFPFIIVAFKIAPAILAGNTVVLKPAPTTPLTTLRLCALLKDVFPPGVLNVIADANDLGAALTAHPEIQKISFTGSTATGQKVLAGGAATMKRITIEAGGNDAAIVLQDVDVKETALKLFQNAFLNNGQVCIALKRVYVHESIYDEMCDALAKLAREAIVGDGLEQGTQLGPLQNKVQYEKVQALIDDSRRHGKIIAGGSRPDRPGYFINPTIVRDISDGTRLVDEEQFGPILPLIKFSDVEDALSRANSSPYGLGGSIWSSDVAKATKLARRMRSGTVWVNKHSELLPHIPFGGANQSGLGVELGQDGLEAFTQFHVVNIAR